MKLTEAQIQALRMVSKRDWPAGEPRLDWLHKGTRQRLVSLDLIAPREGSQQTDPCGGFFRASPIVDLTEAGRQALAAREGE